MKPSDILKALAILHRADKPTMLWGPPGVGKSKLAEQFALSIGARLLDTRLALLDPTDLRGIPYFDPETKTAKWGAPSMLPPEYSEESYILFLDEINAAPPSVQAAAYQLILDRKVGEYSLPKNVYILAAGNRSGDRGVTYEMPAPLENRLVHLDFTVDKDDWIDWAIDNEKHPDTIGFISHSPGSLNDFDPKNKTDHGFPTPRSWSSVSDILEACSKEDSPEILTKNLVSGTIGQGKSIEFFAFRKISSHLPTPEDVLSGKVTSFSDKVKDEISAHHSMIISLIYTLNRTVEDEPSLMDDYMGNFMTFLDNNVQPEFNVFAMSKLSRAKKVRPVQYKSFSPWAKKYNKFF